MAVFIKHISDSYDSQDGLRYLVCDIPDSYSAEQLMLDGCIKNLSPEKIYDNMSDDEWKIFRKNYYQKLMQPENEPLIDSLAKKAMEGNVTILFVESHRTRNHAMVLKTLLELRIKAEFED